MPAHTALMVSQENKIPARLKSLKLSLRAFLSFILCAPYLILETLDEINKQDTCHNLSYFF